MTGPVIYTSPHPTPFLPQLSLFHYAFPDSPGVSPESNYPPETVAYIDGVSGRKITRAEVEDAALRIASGIRALGLKRGDTACIWGVNSIEWTVAAWACLAAGLIVTPASAAYTPEELAHQVNNSGASLMFISPSHIPLFDAARPKLKRALPASRVLLLSQQGENSLKCIYDIAGERAVAERFEHDPNATALLFYSSGTTGLPKGVKTSHYNLTCQFQSGRMSFEPVQSGKDILLGFLPLSHVYGCIIGMFLPVVWGAQTVLMPKYDEIPVLEAIQKHKITIGLLVPPVLLSWLHSPNIEKYDISTLRSVMCGAAPLSGDLVKEVKRRFGFTLFEAYGLTECTGTATSYTTAMAEGRFGWVGVLAPCYQGRLVKEDGTDCKNGEPGELWVRGPAVMLGYHDNEEATRKTIANGGWLMTGDVLIRDDQGWFKVVDRMKELIKYKGLQVAPAELEGKLIDLKNVADAGVIGVWDDTQATELPMAYVVPDQATLKGLKTDADRLAYCKQVQETIASRVSPHKRLRGGVFIIDVIPKSPSGKILRKDLRARAAKQWAKDVKATL